MTETRPHGPRQIRIPDAILRSPLMTRHQGIAVFDTVPDRGTSTQLLAEALAVRASATPQENPEPDAEEHRGGKPMRAFLSAGAGPAQDAFYDSASVRAFLTSVSGVPIVPSGNRGSYSYYARGGDYLDVHRDVDTCDLALITALHDNTDPVDQRGALVVYPERIWEPLSAIRARPYDGAYGVKLQPGQTLAMFGGVVPHRVAPVADGQVRIVSVLCFKAEVEA